MPRRYWNGEEYVEEETPEEQRRREERERIDDERAQMRQKANPPPPPGERLNAGRNPEEGGPPQHPNSLPPWAGGLPPVGQWGRPNMPPQDNGLPGPQPQVQPPASPPLLFADWKAKGYIDQDGMVTLPWGAKVTVQEALKKYYPDSWPSADEVPPWVALPAPTAAGVPLEKWNQLPADMRDIVQAWFQRAYGPNRKAMPAISNMQQQTQYY